MQSGLIMSDILHPIRVSKLVEEWLLEDTSCFDYGGYVVGTKPQTSVILMKCDRCEVVLAGCPFVQQLFEKLGCDVKWNFSEGSILPNELPVRVALVSGPANRLLLGERIALNCLSRASGIATEARRYCKKLRSSGTVVAGTRKTTPGFRLVEKYALLIGGADPHRYDLSTAVMLKDNHVWLAGSVTKAIKKVRQVAGFTVKIEVECRSVDQALEAAENGCDIIMLDNFSPEALHAAAKTIKTEHPKVIIESSGGITFENIDLYAGENIDIISTSKLVQGYPVIDYSMKVVVEGHDPSNPVVTLQVD